MIQVEVARVVIYSNDLIVLLRIPDAEKVLPIHVDPGQAHSIELQLEGLTFPRPLTHDLFKNVLDIVDCTLVRAEVCDLSEGTFYARLLLLKGGKEIEVDARPSDAIALALRCSAPIFVDEDVMEKAGVVIKIDPGEAKTHRKVVQTPLQVLESKLQTAVDDERYEDAAGLRDEIKQLKDDKAAN